VAPSLTLPLAVHDLQSLPPAARDTAAHDLLHASATQPFDLATGPLLRGLLLRRAPDRHLLALTLHHSICDEWSLAIVLRELGALYGAFQTHSPSPLPALPIQYTDFTHWQRAQLQAPRMQQHLAYWKTQLAHLPTLALPTDAPRPPIQSFRGASEVLMVPAAVSTALRRLSQAEGSSLFMTLLAAWQVLLSRYSGQRDIVVGTPIAGRTHTEIEHLIGLFLNLLVVRTDLRGQPSFRAVVRRVREVALAAYEHQELPFEKLVEELQPERDPSRNPLFQVLFDFHNVGSSNPSLPGLSMEPIDVKGGRIKFDLSLIMWEEGEGLAGRLLYNTDLFTPATIRRLRDHFLVLLAAGVTQPDRPVTRLPLLTPAELTDLLHTRNHTAAPFPRHLALHHAIEAQVARSPEAIALSCGDQQLTYAALNARANQLAHTLRDRGVQPGDRVALCTTPTPAMLVAVLAILKAGAAFVPLDPAFPPERLHFILHDADVALVLTEQALAPRFPDPLPLLALDRDTAAWADAPTTNLPPTVDGDALAYLIYTSGSTGRPKGVLIPHRGILNYLHWCADAYGAARGRGAPVQASIAADAIFPSLFAPLLVGTAVLLLDPADPLPALASALATAGDFSFIKITPSQLEVLAQYLPRPPEAGWVHTLVVGAEAVRNEVLRSWQQHAPEIPL
ncbi:MAG TPA: condensation domain-containing protein, partial [Longimicrobiaceae bacterium]|nr:condensation domain-containing protein [Longimicrobiaceae bacterium]